MTISPRHLQGVLRRFRAGFLAAFPALSAAELAAILTGDGETLLAVLQGRYGYTRVEAKMAWNDFVLTYVDGHPVAAGLCGGPAGRWSDAGRFAGSRLWALAQPRSPGNRRGVGPRAGGRGTPAGDLC